MVENKNSTDNYDYILIDTSSVFHRLYYGQKKSTTQPDIKTVNGRKINVLPLKSFVGCILSLKKEFPNSKFIFALDPTDNSQLFRKKKNPSYKENREAKEEELDFSLKLIPNLLGYLGQGFVVEDKFEADDIIATLSSKALKNKEKVLIFSRDKDLYQSMYDDNYIHFLKEFKRVTDYQRQVNYIEKKIISKESQVIQEIGVEPFLLPEKLALCGDKSDNIPNIPQLGEKTAIELLNKYGNFKKFMENFDNVEPKFKKFFEKKEDFLLVLDNMLLTTTFYKMDLPSLKEISELNEKKANAENLDKVFKLLGINVKILKTLTNTAQKPTNQHQYSKPRM